MTTNSFFHRDQEDILYRPRQREVRCFVLERDWGYLKNLVQRVKPGFPGFLSAGFCLSGIAASSFLASLTIATEGQALICWAVFAVSAIASILSFFFARLRKTDRTRCVADVQEYLAHMEDQWATEATDQDELDTTIFSDSCETADGWESIGEGKVAQETECPGVSRPCLRKQSGGDPSGAWKSIGSQLVRGFTFEAWVYHCSARTAGPADRLAVENDSLSGYGFCLTNGGKALWIERRDETKPVVLGKESVHLSPDSWYRFRLSVRQDATVSLQVFNAAAVPIASVGPVQDETHSHFSRVAIHGGGPYFVRDLSITR